MAVITPDSFDTVTNLIEGIEEKNEGDGVWTFRMCQRRDLIQLDCGYDNEEMASIENIYAECREEHRRIYDALCDKGIDGLMSFQEGRLYDGSTISHGRSYEEALAYHQEHSTMNSLTDEAYVLAMTLKNSEIRISLLEGDSDVSVNYSMPRHEDFDPEVQEVFNSIINDQGYIISALARDFDFLNDLVDDDDSMILRTEGILGAAIQKHFGFADSGLTE